MVETSCLLGASIDVSAGRCGDIDAMYLVPTLTSPPCHALQELLSRRYYEVFYPHNGTALTNATENMWLQKCGTHPYNAVDDVDYVAPTPPPAASARRMLQRSDKNW
jgi:hypothetical protein